MALIKDATHGKFAKIVQNNAKHKDSLDNCLDKLNAYCENNGQCDCTMTSCFGKYEIDFSVEDHKGTCGRICFDPENGFYLNSENKEL